MITQHGASAPGPRLDVYSIVHDLDRREFSLYCNGTRAAVFMLERNEEVSPARVIRELTKAIDGERGALDGAELIAAERHEHLKREGWTAEHDDKQNADELACAAAVYALPARLRELRVRPLAAATEFTLREILWPWNRQWWKPTVADRVRELVKAGALIAAEIDRLKRALKGGVL